MQANMMPAITGGLMRGPHSRSNVLSVVRSETGAGTMGATGGDDYSTRCCAARKNSPDRPPAVRISRGGVPQLRGDRWRAVGRNCRPLLFPLLRFAAEPGGTR